MKEISDAALAHLCDVANWPDLTGTRYELIDKIGQGGMGSVYLVRDRELDRPLALKVLTAPPEDTGASHRLTEEARIIARLEHPSIVPVHDCGVLADGRFYYAMKLVRGRRLDESVSPSTPLAERLRLFEKICDAVAFAHAHGVVHRDLKPQNIMLGEFGEVQVMDWGVAKEIGKPNIVCHSVERSNAPASTNHGAVLGTPGYMAPEQARGEVNLIDQRADVYALGAVLHFLLVGRPPATPPAPLRKRDRMIPPPLEAVCLKALAAEPAARHASVTLLAADVADFLARRRVRNYAEGPLETALRWATKYRTALAIILTYLLVRTLLFIFQSRL
jgi:eukaryotic-like serine/threonine-protein kinase